MKRIIALICILCLLFLSIPSAFADHQYLLDSNTRRITEEELWEWDRESLYFMFNEIFARYGFTFDVGGLFYNWFNSQPWYKRIPKVADQTAYDMVTKLEWDNYRTIKKVISQMEASGHPYRKAPGSRLKSWTDYQPPGNWTLTGFQYVDIKSGQKLDVYSSPSQSSWRGANGKAMINTNGAIWASGWENGWLQVFYELNKGGLRVGYVSGQSIQGNVPITDQLHFSYTSSVVIRQCSLTDDPLQCASVITSLYPGDTVTYLTTVTNQNGQVWDYIESIYQGKTVRGFVESGAITIPETTLPNLDQYAQ